MGKMNGIINIPLKVDRDFALSLDEMRTKYGEQFEYLNGLHESQLNFSDFIDGFIDKNVADATIDSNANVSTKDIRSLISEKGKSEDKLFAFNKIFYDMKKIYGLKDSKKWLEAEWNGGFYLHDAFSSTEVPYCYAYDLTRLATEGLFFLKNYNNKAPGHLTTFVDDVIEYISYFCNRSSGAVGLPNLLLWTFYFWKKDVAEGYYLKDPKYYARQSFQKLIYRLNQPFLRIDQSSFSNVSIFDRYYLEALFGGVEFPDGSFAIDDIDDIIEHQKTFMEVISDIRSENIFTYPVLSYSLLKRDDISPEEAAEMIKSKDWRVFKDNEFARWCSDHNCLWNDSNFFLSSNVGTLSNCCRLLSDTSKLDAFINSIGGTALSIGSEKVNTVNLMRIAYESGNDKKKFLEILADRTLLCCKALDVIRHIITRNVQKGLLHNYTEGGIEMDKQYSTVGILGLYEVIKKFGLTSVDEFGYTYYTDEGINFACEIFRVINDVKDNFDDTKMKLLKVNTNDPKYADLAIRYSRNCESVPGERAAVILCQKDNALYDKNEEFIYSNQWIPLSAKCTIKEKLRVSAVLDEKCSGGAISHINIESNFPNTDAAWDMLNKIALSGVIYFAFNTRINVCENHHGFVGSDHCPVCGKPVYDTVQRVVGYLTPSKAYSKDRFREFNSRQWFNYSEELRDL